MCAGKFPAIANPKVQILETNMSTSALVQT